jgi:hypothetical protein
VEVILQSALILSSAGDYWTTAIHIGRKVPLQRLVAVNGERFHFAKLAVFRPSELFSLLLVGEENMCAGFVVSALLFVCDVFQCRASAIFCYSALLERLGLPLVFSDVFLLKCIYIYIYIATLATSFAEVHLKGVLVLHIYV